MWKPIKHSPSRLKFQIDWLRARMIALLMDLLIKHGFRMILHNDETFVCTETIVIGSIEPPAYVYKNLGIFQNHVQPEKCIYQWIVEDLLGVLNGLWT